MKRETVSSVETSLITSRPEPGSWWIAYRIRDLVAEDGEWIDLASSGLLGGAPKGWKARFPEGGPDDLIYLPPARTQGRREWLEWYQRVVPFAVVQLGPGDALPPEGAALTVFDLLQPLLDEDLDRVDLLPPGATVAWPLIAGLTDRDELARTWLPRLAARGAARVRAFKLQLTQGQRRGLAERLPESAFATLFHPPAKGGDRERIWAQRISRHGMEPFVERPAVPLPGPRAARRRVAGVLLEAADISLRLARSPLESQAFFRAAREVESCSYDLESVTREGNLGIFPWLEDEAADLVRDVLLGGSAPLLEALRREYLNGEGEVET